MESEKVSSIRSDSTLDAATARTRRRDGISRNVRILGWASFLNDVASEMVYPLVPQFLINVLGGSRSMLGLIEGLGDTAASLAKLVAGFRSDQVRQRKPFVALGYTVATVCRACKSLAFFPWQLLGLRMLDRLGKGVRTPARDALIIESSTAENRAAAFGYHRAMDHLGAAIGPVLAAIFLYFFPDQLRWLFAASLLPGLAGVVLILWRLKESHPEDAAADRVGGGRSPAGGQARPQAPPRLESFPLLLISVLVFTLGNSSDAFLLVRAREAGISLSAIPLLWFAFHLAKSIGNRAAGPWIDRLGPRRPLIVSWLVYAAVYLAFGWATSAFQIWLLFLAYAVFYSLAEPAEKALVALLSGGSARSFGIYHFVVGLGHLPASLVFGYLYDEFGSVAAFSTGAVLAVLATLLLVQVRTPPAAATR